ncbi:hypothetical protein MEQU1_003171 [Malassezia equina]|uniref:Uncharacterized protein n=1 Tax=Malassezia equina TaxID=1381935 RepID=A0AAF0EFI6_9BASI|nr:hypothetical protein MEQU1_003171 [Malassezia equina]
MAFYGGYGDRHGSGLSPAERAGIGVAVGVACLIMIAIISMFMAKRRRLFTPHIRPGFNTGFYSQQPMGPSQPYVPPNQPPPAYPPPATDPNYASGTQHAPSNSGPYAPPPGPPPSDNAYNPPLDPPPATYPPPAGPPPNP